MMHCGCVDIGFRTPFPKSLHPKSGPIEVSPFAYDVAPLRAQPRF